MGNCQTKVIDASETHSCLYDNIYQLAEDNKTSGDKFNWAYDALSNWDYVNLNGSLHKQFDIAAANKLNQYTTVGSASYTYDANGNLTSDGTYTYEYDAENRLLAVKQSGTPVVTYSYNALGRRISKTAGSTVTRYCYDSDQVIAEYDGTGTLLRKFIYGPGIDEPIGLIVASGASAGTYFYHQDALGSVVALSKFDSVAGYASFVEKYSYSAFGQTKIIAPNNELRTTSLFGNPYMFTGREYEPETGLYYYRARFYNPEIGRFLQTDPIGYADSMNLYQYCGNNSIAYRDPSGMTYNNIGISEVIDVLLVAGPIDSSTASHYKTVTYGGSYESSGQAKTLTGVIVQASIRSVSVNESSQIENAILHALVSAYYYRYINEEDAGQILDVHEQHAPTDQLVDSLKDVKNNVVGRSIGLSSADIPAAVMDAYYRGELYAVYGPMGSQKVDTLKPLPNYVRDLMKESQAITNELKNLVDSFNNRLDIKNNSGG